MRKFIQKESLYNGIYFTVREIKRIKRKTGDCDLLLSRKKSVSCTGMETY